MAVQGTTVKRINSDKVFDAVNLFLWIVVLALVLYPLWLIIVASVSDPDALRSGEVTFLPVNPSGMGYEAVFQHELLLRSYINSIYYTVVGTFISIIITMMAGYALTRTFKGKNFITMYIIITMFFNGGLIPSFLMNMTLGLYNTVFLMIVLNSVSVWNLMIARSFITTNVPNELYEAAAIDGTDHFTYFIKIVLPLSSTIIAVLTVYYAVARWNDYFTALVYIRDNFKLPLQTVMREILTTVTATNFFDAYTDTQGIVEAMRKAEVAKYCCIIVATGPTIVLYMTMQKYFVKGVLIGSIRG